MRAEGTSPAPTMNRAGRSPQARGQSRDTESADNSTGGEPRMRAVRYRTNRVEIDSHSPPTPRHGEALLRLARAGIGWRDRLNAARGDFQGVLGHEFVAQVETVEGPDQSLLGARVVGAVDEPCGQCPLCERGLASQCRHRATPGLRGRDGCLADAFIAPVTGLAPVPDQLDDELAVFAQPVGAALHAARLVPSSPHAMITVLGDGALALLTAQALQRTAQATRLLGDDPARFTLCERWGIRHRHIDDVGRRSDQDAVVVCDPRPQAAQLALQLVRPLGLIVLATQGEPPSSSTPALDPNTIVKNGLHVIGAQGCLLHEALVALASSQIDPLPLIAARMKLSECPAALRGPPDAQELKTLIEP